MSFIIPLNCAVADWLDDSSAEQILDLATLLNKQAASLQFRANEQTKRYKSCLVKIQFFFAKIIWVPKFFIK